MSSRHKKPKDLTEFGREEFVRDAELMHRTIIRYKMNLRPGSPHHDALWKLHDAVMDAIKEITGKDAPWMHRSSS